MSSVHDNLEMAKVRLCDEFYTSYEDIANEIDLYFDRDPDVFRGKTILCPCDDPDISQFTKYFLDNFDRFGMKRLISTSYAREGCQPSLSDFLNGELKGARGKYLIRDDSGIQRGLLNGTGDFRSGGICRYMDGSDIIVTNPPFSLFREFFRWLSDKRFIIMGNMTAISYMDSFPKIMSGEMWLGHSIHGEKQGFIVPDGTPMFASKISSSENKIFVKGVRWFTNVGSPFVPDPISLRTMADNLENNKRLRNAFMREYGVLEYPRYENFDAIEVPFVECIPSDYEGMMGVPISFLDKYNPEQFRLLGITARWFENPAEGIKAQHHPIVRVGDKRISKYTRLLIKRVCR